MGVPREDLFRDPTYVGLSEPSANQVVWMSIVHVEVDLAAAVKKALDRGRLSGLAMCVFYFRYIEECGEPEIAARLGLSVDQVKRLYCKAVKSIRETGVLDSYRRPVSGRKAVKRRRRSR